MSTPATFTVGLVQMRSGFTPSANLDTAIKLIGDAKAAGADYVQTPEMTNIMDIRRERMLTNVVPEESDASLARPRRQPIVSDRPGRRDRCALRQDSHVRRRPRRRRKLSRVEQLQTRRV